MTSFEELTELATTEAKERDAMERRALATATGLFEALRAYLDAPDGDTAFYFAPFDDGPRLIDEHGWIHSGYCRLMLGTVRVDVWPKLHLMREPWRVAVKFSRVDDYPAAVTIDDANAFARFVVDAVRAELIAERTRYTTETTPEITTPPLGLTPASSTVVGFLTTRGDDA